MYSVFVKISLMVNAWARLEFTQELVKESVKPAIEIKKSVCNVVYNH